MKKNLPTDIANDLADSSVFFEERKQRAEGRASQSPVRTYGRTDQTNARTPKGEGERTSSGAPLLESVPQVPKERRPERYAFNFWADQITRLKRLRQVLNLMQGAEERAEVSLSHMVRVAMDRYLEEQIAKLKEGREDGRMAAAVE